MEKNGFKVRYLITVFSVWLACCVPARALTEAPEAAASAFRDAMDGIRNHACLEKGNYGIKIYSLDRQEPLYAFQNDRLFTPASNLKLITTAAALHFLGPDYRFHTFLYSPGKREGKTLHGDLYIKGTGDPKLVSEQMWLLVNELRNLPIHRVVGDIVADDTYFDRQLRVKTWHPNPGPQAYNAPLGALSFNFNTVKVLVKPGLQPGDPPLVLIDPDNDYLRIDNRARTLTPGERTNLAVNRVDNGSYDKITVTGGISPKRKRIRYYINITDPTLYTGKVFKQYLTRAGVEVTGEVRKGKVPKGTPLLLSHESEPLSLALKGLNKFSNNFVAEQILKTLGVEEEGPPGTTEKGLRVIFQFMRSLGYRPADYRIVDGSGLSRQNRISPDQVVRVLEHMRGDLSVYPEFISALGIMGLDGNVKDRMTSVHEAQKARVKTGTLNGISALSGYFQSAEGERFAFSILMNDLKCSHPEVMKLQEKIVQAGLKFRRGAGDGPQ